jgi:hypothetical protein
MIMQREVALVVNLLVGLAEFALVWLFAATLELTDMEIVSIVGFALIIGVVTSTKLIRSRVTPLADPRDHKGRSLAPTTKEPKAVENGITQVAIL